MSPSSTIFIVSLFCQSSAKSFTTVVSCIWDGYGREIEQGTACCSQDKTLAKWISPLKPWPSTSNTSEGPRGAKGCVLVWSSFSSKSHTHLGKYMAQSTQDAHAQREQMGPVDVNGGCPHCIQATSKEKCLNLRTRHVPRPVWIGPIGWNGACGGENLNLRPQGQNCNFEVWLNTWIWPFSVTTNTYQ